MGTHGTGLPTTTVLENIKGRTLNYDPKKTIVIPILIYSVATDSGNTPTTTLRAGMPMAQIRATDHAGYTLWMPMDTTTGGTYADVGLAVCEGILASDVNLLSSAGVVQNTVGSLIVEGTVLETDIKIDYTPVGTGTAPTIVQIVEDLALRRGVIAAAGHATTFERPAQYVVMAAAQAQVALTGETLIRVIPGPTIL